MYLQCWEISFDWFWDIFCHIPTYLDWSEDIPIRSRCFEISRKVQDIQIRFRFLKMAEDIFVSRQGQGGPCCSAAAAAAAAASCTYRRGVLAQTNVSDASRVYYETDSHSHSALSSRAPPPRRGQHHHQRTHPHAAARTHPPPRPCHALESRKGIVHEQGGGGLSLRW